MQIQTQLNLKKRKNNMITLSFKYNKNASINNNLFKKIREISNNKNYRNLTKQLIEIITKSKKKTKSKTKSKSKSKSDSKKKDKNTKKTAYQNTNNIQIYNKIKKFTEKNLAYLSHNNFNKHNNKKKRKFSKLYNENNE